jgi:hypothetical protein
MEFRQGAYDEDVPTLLELVEHAEPGLRGPNQLRWATLLRNESGNLREALDRATHNDLRTALLLVAGLSTFWWMHGLRAEAARAARGVLDGLGPQVPPGLGEEYLLAVLHAAGSATPAEVERAQNATGRRFRRPVTILLWSFVLGPFQPARLVTGVLAANQRSGDAWARAAVQLCKGYAGLTGVDAAGSERALQNALARFRLIGDRWGGALALDALADLAAGSGRSELAADLLGQALELADELGTNEQAASLLCRRGDLRLALADLAAARADFSRALGLGEKAEVPETAAAALIGLARTARYAGDLAAAREFALAAVPDRDADWDGADLAKEEALAELAAADLPAQAQA